MVKKRWVTNNKLDGWFETQMSNLDKWGGYGSSIDALYNFDKNDHLMIIHYEDMMKATDAQDHVHSGMQLGQDVERLDVMVFLLYYKGFNIYILAKNITQLKQMVNEALDGWKESCGPLEEPELPREDVIESLLKDIYSHIQDPKGRSNIESNWCERIEELGLGK